MTKEKIDKLEQKKQQLEEELEKIQYELDDNLNQVRTDVSTRLHPSEIIKRHPLPVVGLSVLAGFLAGHKSGDHSSNDSGKRYNALLWDELKKLATKKSLSMITSYLENMFLEDDGDGHTQNGTPKKD